MDLDSDPDAGIQPRFGSAGQIFDPAAVLDQIFFRIIPAHTDKSVINGLVRDCFPVNGPVGLCHGQAVLGVSSFGITVGLSALLVPVETVFLQIVAGYIVQNLIEVIGVILGDDQIIPVLAADGFQRVAGLLQIVLETVQYLGLCLFTGLFHIPAGISIRHEDHDQEPAQGDQGDHAHQYDIEQIDASQFHSALFIRSCIFQNHTSAADGRRPGSGQILVLTSLGP